MSSSKGSNQAQAGRLAAPDTANDSGKPAAIMTLRHQLLPSKLASTPNAQALATATGGPDPFCNNTTNTAQALAHTSTAGNGHGSRRKGVVFTRAGCLACVDTSATARV